MYVTTDMCENISIKVETTRKFNKQLVWVIYTHVLMKKVICLSHQLRMKWLIMLSVIT